MITYFSRIITSSIISFIIIMIGIVFAALRYTELTSEQKLDMILTLLILVATSEVFERSKQILDLKDSVESKFKLNEEYLNMALNSRFNVILLDGRDHIIRTLNRLQSDDLFGEVQIIIFGEPKSPPEVTEQLIELMRTRVNITQRVILVIDSKNDSLLFRDSITSRLKSYGENNDRVKVKIKHADPPLGIDTYIIQSKHVIFNFSYPFGKEDYYRAMVLEDVTEIAENYRKWFDDIWHSESKLFNEIEDTPNK